MFLLLPPPPARGEAPYQFTLSSGAAFLCGQGEEIVYKYEDRDDYLSRLLWDLKPLFCLETGLEFSRARPQEAPGFLAKTAFRFGVPGLSGVMEDRDWASGSGEFLTN
jgi:outer membrane protease